MQCTYNLGVPMTDRQVQEAIESYKQAIRIDPDMALAHYISCAYRNQASTKRR
jgi:hypothetical protein